MLITDDGSSNPYKVRFADGLESQDWFTLKALVPAEEQDAVRTWMQCCA
jgi:hypothetical protein